MHAKLCGYFLKDIDECELETDTCDVNAECTNTDGSYTCSCNAGYSGDGMTCIGRPSLLLLLV